jgi:hypothetical protein
MQNCSATNVYFAMLRTSTFTGITMYSTLKRLTPLAAFAAVSCKAPGNPSGTSMSAAPTSGLIRHAAAPRPLVQSQAAAGLGLPAVEGREISPEEEQIIQQLETLLAGTPQGSEIRKSLTDPRVSRIDMHFNPRAQALLDRIAAIRDARASRALAEQERQPKVVPVLLAIADHFPLADSTAQAAIVRRPDQEPNDVIVLRVSDVNPVTLGTALRVLNQLRVTTGVVPDRAAVLPVHADSMPESWNRTGLRERAVEDLISLMRANPSDVPGIGSARTMTISLLAPTSVNWRSIRSPRAELRRPSYRYVTKPWGALGESAGR